MFSRRTAWDTSADPLAAELAGLRRTGNVVFDLTASNPTTCGIIYDADLMSRELATGAAQEYAPTAFGLLEARDAVGRYYAEAHDCLAEPQHILLAASTSELYSYAFRLLCDPGDEVLLAQPSYPLFDFLAVLDDVRLRPFRLPYESGWHLDRRGLEQAVTGRSRAVAVIHPNNPTGHFTAAEDRRWLGEFCRDRDLALIVDEVFLDYPGAECRPEDARSFLSEPLPCLALVMSGLSKVCAMPGMKLAWMAAAGPDALVKPALDRLEVIADTFLSASTPVQHALGSFLQARGPVQRQIRARVGANLHRLDEILAENAHLGAAVQRLRCEGGWYAVLRIPAVVPAEDFALGLLRQHGVHVHPGGFFGLPSSGFLVVSLLTPEVEFATGIARLKAAAAELM